MCIRGFCSSGERHKFRRLFHQWWLHKIVADQLTKFWILTIDLDLPEGRVPVAVKENQHPAGIIAGRILAHIRQSPASVCKVADSIARICEEYFVLPPLIDHFEDVEPDTVLVVYRVEERGSFDLGRDNSGRRCGQHFRWERQL